MLLDNALATMGAGLPAAIAAKVIEPSRQCVALCGDGGFMMNSQELETAVRMKHTSSSSSSTTRATRSMEAGDAPPPPPPPPPSPPSPPLTPRLLPAQGTGGFPAYGLDYTNPNFVEYANSYGAVTRTHWKHASRTPPPRLLSPRSSIPPLQVRRRRSRLERTEDLPSLLRACLPQPAVHLIDLPVSYASSDQELNVELKPIVAALAPTNA